MAFLASPLAIALAILALGVLVIIHEAGHFVVARMSGMRVDRFSIGFGPTLWKFRRGDTTYQIAAIPLGGYVQIAGMNPGLEDIAVGDPRAYSNRPVLLRVATIFAGPAMNYVFAALVMVLISSVFGVPTTGRGARIAGVAQGKPADVAGLQVGDEIVSVDGHDVAQYTDLAPLVNGAANALSLQILRQGRRETVSIRPELVGDAHRLGIEVAPVVIRVQQPFATCLLASLRFPYEYSRNTLRSFGDMFAGRQKADFTGPVGIVKIMKQQIQLGAESALTIVAIISICLGLFNLLPLPALDGGRLVFLLCELIARRKVNQRVEQTVHLAGMFALLAFLVFTTFGDLGLRHLFHR